DQLPASSPIKAAAMRMDAAYRKVYGNTVSQFTANAWDSGVLLESALPQALAKVGVHADAAPDTAALRVALRDALEGLHEVPGPDGIYSMSPTNHDGPQAHAVVMVRIAHGAWELVK
ncbi:MAG: branched-chain amino acid ABC transporter substrate-binding protein, partial [Betaproteobacteria bacterium]|nr:branched-chain amino acid ABC transporter substrate-binding protein [Betaproteobacteria bacterium]